MRSERQCECSGPEKKCPRTFCIIRKKPWKGKCDFGIDASVEATLDAVLNSIIEPVFMQTTTNFVEIYDECRGIMAKSAHDRPED